MDQQFSIFLKKNKPFQVIQMEVHLDQIFLMTNYGFYILQTQRQIKYSKVDRIIDQESLEQTFQSQNKLEMFFMSLDLGDPNFLSSLITTCDQK